MTGYRYQEITGAKSVTLTEAGNKLTVYDKSTFRNVFSAGELGRAWGAAVVAPFISGGAPEGADDRLNATAPREWAKPDTMIMWWDTLGGTGKCLGMCRYDDFVSYSDKAPQLMY